MPSTENVDGVVDSFHQEMEREGMLTQDRIIPDGKFHGFHMERDKPGKKHGWYILHLDPYAVGTFADWRLGERHTWKAPFPKKLSREERAALERRCAEARAKEQAEIERREAKARREAQYIWKHTDPAPEDHPYLQKKKIEPNGARLYKRCLVLPVRDVEGNLHSLQLISPTGEKRFLTGGRTAGCLYDLGKIGKHLYIAEGFATGATVYEATGEAVAVTFHAGNLKAVAGALRKKDPKMEIVLAADNDAWTEGNPGLAKALEAAKAIKGKVAVPRFRDASTQPTDFNDLLVLEGAGKVREQLRRARAPEMWENIPGVLASEVRPEEIEWLWLNHIPRGAMTLLDGDPSRGKSCIALDLAARISQGWRLPDGTDAQLPARGVVVISLEDPVSRAIVPRLKAAGADLERVRIIETIPGADGTERLVTITQDVLPVEKALHDVDAAFLVVDPVMATFDPQTNTWKDQEVRRALVPLIKLAERRNIALLVLRHFNKAGGSNPLYRGGGSIAFIAAARAAWVVGRDPDDPTSCIMAMSKSNFGPKQPSLRYRIVGYPKPPRIDWEGESPHTAVNLLDDSEGEEGRSARNDASEFIRALLANGPVPSEEVFTKGRKQGFSDKTLKRAKKDLGVRSRLVGQGRDGKWQWELSEGAKSAPEGVNIDKLAPSDQLIEPTAFSPTASPERANSEILTPSDPQLAPSETRQSIPKPSEAVPTNPPKLAPAGHPKRRESL
jgi:putative DNA primase/helicase